MSETPNLERERSTSPTIVDAPDPAAEVLAHLSKGKKYILLVIFTLAQFMDVAGYSMLFPAIPALSTDLKMEGAQSSWVFAAYQATFSSFLLISGRACDVYTPKPIFIGGNLVLGAFCLATGFIRKKIPFFILRSLAGLGASCTIPAALSMIVRIFPQPKEQAVAIAVFGATGAIGNVGGLLIGAIFTEFVSWHWIFWFIACVTLPIAIFCIFYIPSMPRQGKKYGLDIVGVSILIISLLLFVFALTQGANTGWGHSEVIAPLVISIFTTVAFFLWESRINPLNAALPPKLWFYSNFSVLFFISLFGPYFWWVTILFLIVSWWQDVLHYSIIMTAVRFLPIGIVAAIVPSIIQNIIHRVQAKKILVVSQIVMFIGTILLPFADTRDRYWPLMFIAFILGSSSAMAMYITSSIAFFQTTPPEYAGIVGAVWNSALQLGAAFAVAVTVSIQTSIDRQHPTKMHGYAGRAAAFWFVVATTVCLLVGTVAFYKSPPSGSVEVGVVAPAMVVKDDLEKGEREKDVTSEGSVAAPTPEPTVVPVDPPAT